MAKLLGSLETAQGASGENLFFVRPSTYVNRYAVSTTAVAITVPAGYTAASFDSNGVVFYANFNGTATLPGANITDGSASVSNPANVIVTGGSTISLIAASATTITVAYYK